LPLLPLKFAVRAALLAQILAGLENPLKFDAEQICRSRASKIYLRMRRRSVNLTANGGVFYILNLEISC
jgi:hypothetical protein